MRKQMDKGILTDIDVKQTKYKVWYVIIIVCLIFIGVFICLFPVIWVCLSGFKTVEEMYSIPVKIFPDHINISKLLTVWTEMRFYKYYLSTFIMAGGMALFDMVISGFAGYSLSKIRPIGTKLILVVLFWVMLLPGTVRTVPVYMTFKNFPLGNFNMLNTYWPLWLMAVNAFDIILFKNFFDGISNALVEAGRIDGADTLRIFFRIILPLSIPVFTVVGIFTFNGGIGQFFWPLILLSDKDKTVLGVQIYKMKSGNFSIDYQMLAIIFSMIPQIVVFLLFQHQIMGGINVGGVKE